MQKKNDIILEAGFKSRPEPSILSGDAGRPRSAELRELSKQQGQVLGRRGKRLEGGGRRKELVAFRSSNHSGEGKSRPLRRQPVRARWEGVRAAQAVLFIKHTPPN